MRWRAEASRSVSSHVGEDREGDAVASKHRNRAIQQRQTRIILVAVALVLASIIYSPYHVRYSIEAIGFKSESFDYVEYDFLWDPPLHSTLDYHRLAPTWVGIASVAGLALFLNHTSNQSVRE
jgi:hypothetical protein